MQRVNIATPSFQYDDEDPDGYRSGVVRLGKLVGAASTGASVYELPPGQALCPYHYEWAEEEWVVVLEGRPLLRTPDGEQALEPWDVVWFAKGPEGAHRLRNDGDEPVRVLMFSDVVHPAATVYPDSDKVGVWTRPGEGLTFTRSTAVGYYDGEV